MMKFLKKISFNSPRISGHIMTRQTGIQAYDWYIASPDGVGDDIKQRLKNFINDYIIKLYMRSPMYGLYALNYEFVNYNGANVPRPLKIYEPEAIDFEGSDIIYTEGKQKFRVYEPLQNGWLTHIYNPSYRGGILRTVGLFEILRNESIQEWASYNKRLKGILAGLIDPQKYEDTQSRLGLSDEQMAKSMDNIDFALENAGSNNWFRAHNFADIKAFQIADAQASGSFSNIINFYDTNIAIAILGQANTSELPSGGGSRAALEVLNLIRNDIIFYDMNNIQSIANDLLLQYYRRNYDPAAQESPYSFEFVYDDETEDVEANARVLETISRIPGVLLNSDELYRKIKMTKPANVPDVITLQQPTAIV